jgi:hypothetical protein
MERAQISNKWVRQLKMVVWDRHDVYQAEE